jgi:hypothetical protein
MKTNVVEDSIAIDAAVVEVVVLVHVDATSPLLP